MAYEEYEKALIREYGNDIESGKILPDNKDISNGKARNKYNQYISSIIKLKPREFNITSFPIMGIGKVIELSTAIIVTIYGEQILPVLEEFFEVLTPSETLAALDGISLSILNKETLEEVKIVEVPDLKYSSTITTIVHEFTHFLLKKYNVDFSKKRYYEEILSIYAEKLANIFIANELKTGKALFQGKMEECRLEIINWHYDFNLPLLEQNITHYNRLRQKKEKTLGDMHTIASIEQSIPQVKTAKGQSILRGYYQNMADSYGIGYLYGTSLVERHLDDFATIKKQLTSVLEGRLSFQDLLNYYDISARNYRVYDTVEKELELIKRNR